MSLLKSDLNGNLQDNNYQFFDVSIQLLILSHKPASLILGQNIDDKSSRSYQYHRSQLLTRIP